MYIIDEKPSGLRGDRRRVLVVADDPDVTGLLGAAMELAGFRVATAGTGADGMVRLAQNRFDLVVWDATLPGSAGSARGRLLTQTDRPPLLFLTTCDSLHRLVPELGLDGGSSPA